MNQSSCDIVRDLLPLYYDEVCSNGSKKLVEEHLAGCRACKSEFDKIQVEIIVPMEEMNKNKNDRTMIKSIATSWKGLKRKAFLKGTIVTALLFSVIILGYNGLFKWPIASVSTDVVKITNVSELADESIAFHVELTDGYSLRRLKYRMDDEGNFYLTPLRTVMKEKTQLPYGLENGYDVLNIENQQTNQGDKEITAVYYGTPKDRILIWEKGMDLPAASKEIEDRFNYH